MDLNNAISNLNTGVFINDGSRKAESYQNGSGFIKIKETRLETIDKNKSRKIRVEITNKSVESVKINSICVLDIEIDAKYAPIEILEHGWLQCSSTKYRNPSCQTKQNKVILKRDQNIFSFKKSFGYLEQSIISEWFTVIRFKKGSLVIGASTTSSCFSQIFIRSKNNKIRIRVTCQYDGIKLHPNETISSENIFIQFGNEDKILNNFAKEIKKDMHIKETDSRIKAFSSAYVWNKNSVNQQIIHEQLDIIGKLAEKPSFDFIQIDAGYCNTWGDWLDYNKNFPNGMKPIVKKINNLNYKAGIWLSPFVANPNSNLFRTHKEWFLKDDRGSEFDPRQTSPFDFMVKDLRYRVLNPYDDNVQKYLETVLHSFLKDGFEMFKLDFLYPVCMTTNYGKNSTRVQALRKGLEVIREIVGNKVHLLAAVTPISPLVGVIDTVRTGIDTVNPFFNHILFINRIVNNYMLRNSLEASKIRLFMNGIVWNTDPDAIIFKNEYGTAIDLINEHKHLVKNNKKMSMWVADNLTAMNKNKLVEFINDLE